MVKTSEIIEKVKKIDIPMLIAAFAASFFLVSSVCICTVNTEKYYDISFVKEVNVALFIMATAILTAGLFAVSQIFKIRRLIPLLLVTSLTLLLTLYSMSTDNLIWFYVGFAFLMLIAMRFYVKNTDEYCCDELFTYRNNMIFAAFAFVAFTVMNSVSTIYNYKAYGPSCFDFGIFSQMFEYMRTTGLPNTTVERNCLLSHFAVHFSPFFYLLLPGYLLTPNPCYLFAAQAFCVGIGALAIPGICRELGVKPKHTFMFTLIYILYPTLSYGLNYDFHENKFLTVCIIWTLYFMLKRKYIPMYAFALMTCMVKEDAAIYIVAIALFMMFERKDMKAGAILLVGALVYFVFALKMVQVCGGGEDEFGYRYSAFDDGEGASIGKILKTIIFDFGFALKTMFTLEKIEFLMWMLIPVAFLPFCTSDISTLLLLTPMLFVNFLTSWKYQYDIFYQYTFGAAALIIVSAIYVFSKLSQRSRRTLVGVALAMCIIITVPKFISSYEYHIDSYKSDSVIFDDTEKIIYEYVPLDASVTADGCLIPHMYKYKNMYLKPYDEQKTDYYILDANDMNLFEVYEGIKNDYTLIAINGKCAIMKRNDILEESEGLYI